MEVSRDSARLDRLDAQVPRRSARATRPVFVAHRGEPDDLNAIAVPNGATGTNHHITVECALAAARDPREASPGSSAVVPGALAEHAAAPARATLLAVGGNCWVILSQLIQGLSQVIDESVTPGPEGPDHVDRFERIDEPTLARAVRLASDRAYPSVTRPVEATILPVATVAAELTAAVGGHLYAVTPARSCAALLTLINGAGSEPEPLVLVAAGARAGRGERGVAIIDGGHGSYPLLLGVQ